ncbi:hypothetical protein [Novosphingobium sp.]|uniref:hypothetical protein n=1 Tax=Novosphingobium sp. TaxID=1874826 RepID=UPI0025E39B49|nr:hypothetical protein [Novosphingobium sp.]MCC6926912.1 hypothetical protein [Novosphingobium sp.]
MYPSRVIHCCASAVTGVPIAARLANAPLAFVFGIVGGGIVAMFYLKSDRFSHWWDRGALERFSGLFWSISLLAIGGMAVAVSAHSSGRPLQVSTLVAALGGHLLAIVAAIYALAKREDKL